MKKIINKWFICDKCGSESDKGAERKDNGKKMKICSDCLEKMEKEEKSKK